MHIRNPKKGLVSPISWKYPSHRRSKGLNSNRRTANELRNMKISKKSVTPTSELQLLVDVVGFASYDEKLRHESFKEFSLGQSSGHDIITFGGGQGEGDGGPQ